MLNVECVMCNVVYNIGTVGRGRPALRVLNV